MATVNLGKIKLKWRGTWSSGGSYTADDVVEYTDGSVTSSYIAVAASSNQAPSTGGSANSSYWNYLAKGQATSPTTTQGDLIVRGASADERLAIGSAGQALKVNSSANGLEYGAGGGLIQTVSTTKTNTFSTNSQSFVDVTGLSATITPTSSSNKILVIVNIGYGGHQNLYGWGKLVRTTSGGSPVDICIGNAASNRVRASLSFSMTNLDNQKYKQKHASCSFLDSPNTTTSTTYKVMVMTENGSRDVHINYSQNDGDAAYSGRLASSITCMEVIA